MRRLTLLALLVVLGVMCVSQPKEGKVLLVVFEGYQPKEYFPIKERLESRGIETKTLAMNKEVDVPYDYYIENVNESIADEFDAIVVIGGPGVYQRIVGLKAEPNMEKLYSLLHAFNDKGKIVAAICASPAILAKAGLLNGKQATVWASEDLIAILGQNNATYTGELVTRDGNILTGNGPQAAIAFADAVAEAISEP